MLICSPFNTSLHSSQHIGIWCPLSFWAHSDRPTWQKMACWRLTLLLTENSVISLWTATQASQSKQRNSDVFASCNTTTQIPTTAAGEFLFAELPLPPIGALPPMGALPPIGALPPTGPLLAIGDFPPIGPLPPMPFMPPIGALPPPECKPCNLLPVPIS